MKKIIALVLAILMLLAMVACGTKTEAPAAEPAAEPAAKPAAEVKPVEAELPPVEEGAADVSAAENDIGYFSSGIDPASRDTYNVVWMYMRPMALFQNITDALKSLEGVFNFEVTDYCANSDIDALIQNIEIYASQGADGFMVVVDPTASTRIKQVLDNTGLPYVAMLNSVRDENGSEIVPCVGIEGVVAGRETVQWLYDNYKTYWGDVDLSTKNVGLLDFNFSPNSDFNDRYTGSKERFLELFPDGKVFDADGVSGQMDEQTGYDLASAILAANPDIDYWFVAGCLELYTQGATRAVESLNMEDCVLLTAVGSDVLPAEWDNGYSGCWVSCLALSNYQYTAPAISALVAMMDGKIDADTLWSSRRAEGDQVTFYNVNYGMLTKENYNDYFAKVRTDVGLG